MIDKIFCTDTVSWNEVEKWLGISKKQIDKYDKLDKDTLYASDIEELLNKIMQKDIESCTEEKEIEYFDCLAENLLAQVEPDASKEYASLLYWIADVLSGGMEKYEKALDVLKEGTDRAKACYGEDSWECAQYYNLMGGLHYVLDDFEKGIQYCEKAIAVLQREAVKYAADNDVRKKIESQLAVCYSDAAVICVRSEQYQKGHEYIAEAKKWLETITEDKVLQAKVYYTIGTFYESMKSVRDSLKYLKKAFHIYRKKKMTHQLRITGISGLMSFEYDKLGKRWPAIYYGKIAVECRERTLGEYSMAARQMQNNLGVMYARGPFYKKGWELLEKSMRNIDELKEEEYLDGACICFGAAVGFFKNKDRDMEKSMACLEKSALLLDRVTDEREESKLLLYENIAARYCEVKKYQKAVQYQKILIEKESGIFKACKEQEKALVGRRIADHIANLGRFYNTMGQKARAIEQYEEAYRFSCEVFGKNSDMAGSLCLTLSELYLQIGDVDSAKERGELACEIAKKVYGTQSWIVKQTEAYLNHMVRDSQVEERPSVVDKIMEILFGKKK